MTWLGKILLVVVMLMALVWVWLIANDFATRVNWKAQAEMYKKGYQEVLKARQDEYAGHLAERDALYRKAETVEKDIPVPYSA